MFRSAILSLGIVLLAGCASAPLKMTNITEGNWSGRALIKDKEHSRSFIVVLNFNAVKNQSLRVDVTSTLGQHVATLVVNNGEVKYYTSDSKKFYVGSPRPDSLKPILAIPMDPHWLQNILWDEPITGKNWTCENGADNLVAQCKEAHSNLSINWSNRKGASKTIDLAHPRAEIQILLRSFSPKVEQTDGLFDLQPPQGYHRVKLR